MESARIPLNYVLEVMRDEHQNAVHGWTLPHPLRPIVMPELLGLPESYVGRSRQIAESTIMWQTLSGALADL